MSSNKKGEWLEQPHNKQSERNSTLWKCSECGQIIYSESEHDRKEFHKFCGKCGAEMN